MPEPIKDKPFSDPAYFDKGISWPIQLPPQPEPIISYGPAYFAPYVPEPLSRRVRLARFIFQSRTNTASLILVLASLFVGSASQMIRDAGLVGLFVATVLDFCLWAIVRDMLRAFGEHQDD